MKFIKHQAYLLSICLCLLNSLPKAGNTAESIMLYKNIFSKTITVKELENFVQTGHADGFLKVLIKKENPQKIKDILTDKYKTPIELTSRLLYSKIGAVILTRMSKVINPYRIRNQKMSILALKAGTIKAINKKTESITLLDFIKAYPSKVIAIDVTELSKVIHKVESMNELVKFFSNSPLEKLKNESA